MQPVKKELLGVDMWFLNDLLHREDGPAVDDVRGNCEWWLHGKRHREDGPAVENRTDFQWWVHGLLHREDGPAVIRYNAEGDIISEEYWLNGIKININ